MDKKIIYKEFPMPNFFDISTTKGIDKKQVVMCDGGKYEFIGRSSVNWGVQGYTNLLNFPPNPKNSFSLVQVGETIALWREKEWYASQNIFLLTPKFDCIKDNKLYFQTVINAEMRVYGKDYNSYPTIDKLNNTTISLPIKTDEDNNPIIDDTCEYHKDGFIPDFDFMEEFIQKKIEKETCKKIEECIREMIGDTFLLTEKEQKTLDGKKNKVEKNFIVGEVFGTSKLGKYHNPDNLIVDAHGYEYICASNENNGVNQKMPKVNGDNLSLTPKNIIAWGKQCPMFTYHKDNCVTGQGMYYLNMDGYSTNTCLYIIAALTAACRNKYSYNNCLIGSKLDKELISLPIKTDEDNNPIIDDTCEYHKDGFIPDFDFMESYISGLRKKEYKKMCDDTEDGSIRVSHI